MPAIIRRHIAYPPRPVIPEAKRVIQSQHREFWTERQDDILRAEGPKKSLSHLTSVLGRSEKAIKSHARKIGVKLMPFVLWDSRE